MAEMPDYRAIENSLQQILNSERRPVAMAFLNAAPQGIAKFEGSAPSSCSYWRLAAAGQTFYTVASDHWNCPIGGYTHNTLTPERMPELQQVLGLMSEIGYVKMEEIPGIFHMAEPPAVIVYGPLAEIPVAPSVVLASGRPGRVMMLAEAALRAGAMSNLPLLTRPTCMAIPAAMAHGSVTSAGCIGNRVYTDIGDDELYVTLRGADLERVAQQIETIRSANVTLTEYHRDRRKTLSTV